MAIKDGGAAEIVLEVIAWHCWIEGYDKRDESATPVLP